MASKAQRKRTRKAAVRSRAGRPLTVAKAGARYPCGKLRPEPVTPNQAVLDQRAALLSQGAGLGDLASKDSAFAAAENPLDLARHRGWLTKSEHAAGTLVQELYRRAGLDLPTLRTQDFGKVAKAHSEAMGNAAKMTQLRDLWEKLKTWPQARAAIFAFCVMGERPLWMIDRLNGNPRGEHNVAYAHLRTGLAIVGRELGVGATAERSAA